MINYLPKPSNISNLKNKFKSILVVLNENKIYGREAIHILIEFNDAGYFTEGVECAFVGEKTKDENGNISYDRKVLIKEIFQNNKTYYIIDAQKLEINDITLQELKEKFSKGELCYEDKNFQIGELEEK